MSKESIEIIINNLRNLHRRTLNYNTGKGESKINDGIARSLISI
jgi:hypothetical protein